MKERKNALLNILGVFRVGTWLTFHRPPDIYNPYCPPQEMSGNYFAVQCDKLSSSKSVQQLHQLQRTGMNPRIGVSRTWKKVIRRTHVSGEEY